MNVGNPKVEPSETLSQITKLVQEVGAKKLFILLGTLGYGGTIKVYTIEFIFKFAFWTIS